MNDAKATPEIEAARAEVLAARSGLASEVVRLEASARAAVDIPARLRRAPAKTAGAAAGAAFLLLGGPIRVLRGVRRAVLGPEADLPKSMLPREIEKEVRKLGSDGRRVRSVLEREFARYLEEKSDVRRQRDIVAMLALVVGNVLRPVSSRVGKRLAEQLFEPDGPSFEAGLRAASERARMARDGVTAGTMPGGRVAKRQTRRP